MQAPRQGNVQAIGQEGDKDVGLDDALVGQLTLFSDPFRTLR